MGCEEFEVFGNTDGVKGDGIHGAWIGKSMGILERRVQQGGHDGKLDTLDQGRYMQI